MEDEVDQILNSGIESWSRLGFGAIIGEGEALAMLPSQLWDRYTHRHTDTHANIIPTQTS